jgi:hypothetical protein
LLLLRIIAPAVQILLLPILRTMLVLMLWLRLRLGVRLVRNGSISRQSGTHIAAHRAEIGGDKRLKRLHMRCMHLVLRLRIAAEEMCELGTR